MKRSFALFFPVAALLANVGNCQPPDAAAPPASESKSTDDDKQPTRDATDPATPSPKIDDVLTAIRGVQELNKLQQDVDRLRAQTEQLSQLVEKQAADHAKLIESLRATVTQQAVEQKKLLAEANEGFQKQLAEQQRRLDQKLLDESADRAKLKDRLESTMAEQAQQQQKLLAELAARLNDLNARLSTIPPVKLQALIADDTQAGAAIVEIGGTSRLVRGGESFTLPPDAESDVARSVFVKEVTDRSVVLEVGPFGQQIVIR